MRVGVRAPKRPSATSSFFKFLRAGAKLAVNDGKRFSNFSRRAKIEASTRQVSFSALSTPPAVQGRVKKLYFIKSTIYARWCAHNLNAAVERRRAARQPLIPYRPASVFGSSENRREVSRSAPPPYRGDGVHMALTQPLSVVAPRGSLSYPTDRRPSLVPAKTAGK